MLLVITRLTVGGDTNVLLDIASHFRTHPTIEAEIAAGPVPAHEVDMTYLAHERRIPTTIIATLNNQPNPLHMLKAIAELRSLMRRGRYDIVHTHSSAAGIVGRLAAVSAGVPIIVHHVHGWGLQQDISFAKRHAYLVLERLCARFTDRLVAVSLPTVTKGLTNRIAREGKYAVIYNGIPLETFRQTVDPVATRLKLGLDSDCKLIGMIGRLEKQKNPLDFIRAVARVVPRCPTAQFVIIGEGSLRQKCEELIRSLGVREHCHLLGFRDDVASILPTLTAVVSTSLWEGLPIVFQEAMCAGVPVIANDVDGVSDIVVDGETGYLVRPRDLDSVSERIVRLLHDEDLRNRLGRRAQLESAAFSTDQMLNHIELLYSQLASSLA